MKAGEKRIKKKQRVKAADTDKFLSAA